MIVVAACDSYYASYTAAMLMSLLRHNKVERIYLIVPHGFDETLRMQLCFAGLEIIEVDLDQSLKVSHHFKPAVYLKLSLGAVPCKRALYLDSDILITGALDLLWRTDLQGNVLAAVIDPKANDMPTLRQHLGFDAGMLYFNSGVMLIDLNRWREDMVGERALAFTRAYPERITWVEQCALNFIVRGKFVVLPKKYNHQHLHNEADAAKARVIHYTGGRKPWNSASRLPFKREYMGYLERLAWA